MKESQSNLKDWRISKCSELRAKGLSQVEISRELRISEASVSRDIAYFEKSKENIAQYINHILPQEFDKIHTGLELVNKKCWQRYDAATTDKERYMFLSLAKETYQLKAALLDSNLILDRAIKFIHNTRGLTAQNTRVAIVTTEEQAQSERDISAKQAQDSRKHMLPLDTNTEQAQSGGDISANSGTATINGTVFRANQAQSGRINPAKQKRVIKNDHTTKP